MQALAPQRVRNAILGSRDQSAAVAMMLRSDRLFEPAAIIEDVSLVWSGRISPVLLWDKHPAGIGLALVVLVVMLLLMRRLFSRRRAATPAPT
jgi:hypothetical protein